MNDKLNLYDNFLAETDPDRLQKILLRYELFRMTLDVPGEIVECGVFKGSGIYTWVKFMRLFKPNNEYHIVGFDFFDTDRGMSFKHDEDQECLDVHKENWATQQEIKDNCARWGFDNVKLIAGNMTDTTRRFRAENLGSRISLLYIDVDNYEGSLACLNNLYPLVVRGGVVALDEYALRGYGESDAVDEFLKDKPVKLKSFPWGNTPTAYFIKE